MKIDIWSDVICPFCYIGKRKLEVALNKTELKAQIEWHSFELNPSSPRTYGISLPELLGSMYGMSSIQAHGVLRHEEEEAVRMGLDFQWRIAKPGNTFDAHRLIHLGKQRSLGDLVQERFLRAYFTEGLEIGNYEVLRSLAIEMGLAPDEVDHVLNSDLFSTQVREDEQQATRLGIRGVPYFVINGRSAISGAREVDEFVHVLQDHADRNEPRQNQVKPNTVECGDGFCETRN